MKKIITVTLAAFLALTAFAADSESIKPVGNVSSYTQSEFNITTKFGDYYRTASSKFLHILNPKTGLEIEVDEYTSKDVLLSKVTYDYDTSLNLIATKLYNDQEELVLKTEITYTDDGQKKDESDYDEEGNLTARTIYKYEDGKIDKSYYTAQGKLLEKCITKYNGDLISEVLSYADDGSLTEREVYSYTEEGKILAIETYNYNNEYSGKQAWRYNDKGQILEQQYYNAANVLTGRDVYTYKNDVNGNPSRVSRYNVAEKFGSTVNELFFVTDYSYKY